MKQVSISPLTLPKKQKVSRTVQYAVMFSGTDIAPIALVVELKRSIDLWGLEKTISKQIQGRTGLKLDFNVDGIIRGDIDGDFANFVFDEEVTLSTSHGRGHSLSLSVIGESAKGDYKLSFIGSSDTTNEDEVEAEFSEKLEVELSDYESSILSVFSISKLQLDYIIKASDKPSLASFEGRSGQEELISLIEEFKSIMRK